MLAKQIIAHFAIDFNTIFQAVKKEGGRTSDAALDKTKPRGYNITTRRYTLMNAIEFKDFACYYKYKREYITALSDLNLTVRCGEFLAVVGESGSGKSTLLKACLGLAEYYEGELIIDGESIAELDLKNGKFAFMSQEIILYPNLTVYENIAFPLRIIKTSQEEIDRRVKEVADIIGMPRLLNRKPRQLSLGQQQRVAIGRAIIKNPAYLFFDEPFSSVDKDMRMELRKMLLNLHRRYKPTVIFVTHDLPEAFALADRIIVLEDGKIAETGTPDELRQSARSGLIRGFLGLETEEI